MNLWTPFGVVARPIQSSLAQAEAAIERDGCNCKPSAPLLLAPQPRFREHTRFRCKISPDANDASRQTHAGIRAARPKRLSVRGGAQRRFPTSAVQSPTPCQGPPNEGRAAESGAPGRRCRPHNGHSASDLQRWPFQMAAARMERACQERVRHPLPCPSPHQARSLSSTAS